MKNFFSFILLIYSSVAFSVEVNADKKNEETLSKWLLDNKSYRLANVSDCNCVDLIKNHIADYGENYMPYKINADFDGDGVSDLAVIVVNPKSSKDFMLLVFASHIVNGDKPIVYGNIFDTSLEGLGLFKGVSNKNRSNLLFGAFDSEAEVIYIPMQVPK